jgi:hypothetical protein
MTSAPFQCIGESEKKMRKTPWFFRAVITACVGLLGSATQADSITYDVTLDTSSLESLVSTYGPFSLDLQLLPGGTTANNVTISNFSYGTGGSAGSPAATIGNASGDIFTSVFLNESVLPSLDNELYEPFTPGDTLSFQVASSINPALPTDTPDGFFFNILDNTLNNIPTQGSSNELLYFAYNSGGPTLATYEGADPYNSLPAPSVAVVPEPATLALLGIGANWLLWRRRR